MICSSSYRLRAHFAVSFFAVASGIECGTFLQNSCYNLLQRFLCDRHSKYKRELFFLTSRTKNCMDAPSYTMFTNTHQHVQFQTRFYNISPSLIFGQFKLSSLGKKFFFLSFTARLTQLIQERCCRVYNQFVNDRQCISEDATFSTQKLGQFL